MKNPFENIFKKPEEKPEYTGEKKFTTDAAGSIVPEETVQADKKFDEGEE